MTNIVQFYIDFNDNKAAVVRTNVPLVEDGNAAQSNQIVFGKDGCYAPHIDVFPNLYNNHVFLRSFSPIEDVYKYGSSGDKETVTHHFRAKRRSINEIKYVTLYKTIDEVTTKTSFVVGVEVDANGKVVCSVDDYFADENNQCIIKLPYGSTDSVTVNEETLSPSEDYTYTISVTNITTVKVGNHEFSLYPNGLTETKCEGYRIEDVTELANYIIAADIVGSNILDVQEFIRENLILGLAISSEMFVNKLPSIYKVPVAFIGDNMYRNIIGIGANRFESR